MLKKVLLALVLVVAGIAVYAWTRPDTFTVERSIRIDAPPQRIYPLIADFRQWQRWSPWEKLDPAMERMHEGPSSGAGARYSWKGNDSVGSGQMTITAAAMPRRVDINLQFIEPMASSSKTRFDITPDGGGSAVRWTMTGDSPYFLKLMSVFANLDTMLGKDVETGLMQLKQAAESRVAPQP
ncbi:MAG: polyketide cyclase [Pseudoxanthomonas suwonensis]|nr:MAG: polyketide cyclase [Pseudoxanthomonas suwonensis]